MIFGTILELKSGQRWHDAIEQALTRAEVAVLLISANFYASDFIDKNELPPLLEAAESARGLVILCVHVNYSDFENDPRLSRYQSVNKPNRPLKALRSTAEQEKAFLNLARRIRELVPLARSSPPPIPREYLEWLERRYASAELLGQDIKESHAFKLSHVYVPAVTQRDLEAEIRYGEDWTRPVPLLQRVDQKSLYVSAPAGAGKSTFCRWAALQSIPGAEKPHPVPAPEEFQEPVPAELRSRLPLLVPLREFCKDMDCSRGQRSWHQDELEQALAAWIDRSPPPALSGALLKDHLAAGSTFLLLDGLDEVAVSETRDGTTVYPRALLLSGLADALAVGQPVGEPNWRAADNRILLTSRPYGLDEAGVSRLSLERASLEPLPGPLQALFVTRWFHTLSKPELAEQLLEAIAGRADLAPLTENPMLLTSMCVLYDKGGRLPEDRYELYKSIVDGVLHNRYPGDAREREPVLRRLEAIAHGMHAGEPGAELRQTPAAEISWVEAERLLSDFAERNPALGRGEVAAAIQRDELLTRSGLLVPRPGERAAFYHLSFQEFLAAQRVARGSDTRVEQVIRERGAVPEWRPTLLFLFAAQVFNKDPEWGLDLLARLLASQERAAVKANPATSVLVAEALELCLAKRYRVPDEVAESFRQLSLAAIEDEIEVRDRQALGVCLGRLGDPRIFDLRDPRASVDVAVGTYPYGEEGGTIDIKAPLRIGRYPVTNSQYQAFMDEGGYSQPEKWWSEAGLAWLREEGVTEPGLWRDRRWNGPNQPVVSVSFFEAEACAAWAGGRLPEEQEWEAAARGPEGYRYPWGGRWQDGICNTGEAGLHVTSSVGLFPGSRQARLGIEDLAGNVWDWCASIYGEDSGSARRAKEPRMRVLRGGSWNFNRNSARSTIRDGNFPDGRSGHIGFRLVCSCTI